MGLLEADEGHGRPPWTPYVSHLGVSGRPGLQCSPGHDGATSHLFLLEYNYLLRVKTEGAMGEICGFYSGTGACPRKRKDFLMARVKGWAMPASSVKTMPTPWL